MARCLEVNGLSKVDVANTNSPTQTVIAGAPDDLERARTAFEAMDGGVVPLNTSGAFHSRSMARVRSEFEHALASVEFAPLRIPVIANVSAEPYQQGRCVRPGSPDHPSGEMAREHALPAGSR